MRTIYIDKYLPKMLLVKAFTPLWRNVVFSPLSSAHFADVAEPPLPGPHWVRVRNKLSGICASDLSLLYVEADPKTAPAVLPGNQRFYLGHEVVSRVTEIGTAVTMLKVGDRVIMDTAFAGANCATQDIVPACDACRTGNRMLCENASLGTALRGVGGGWSDGYTAHQTEVYKVPDGLSDEQAMMVEPLSVGVRAVLRRLPKADHKVLVLGSGIIGLTVVEAARALAPDAHITAVARYPHQVEMALRLGADEIVRGEDGYEATARLTGAKLYSGMFSSRMLLGGFDVIYDCVGTSQSLQDCLRWTKAGGAVVLAGVKIKPLKVDLTPVWYQEVDLVGLLGHGMEELDGTLVSTYDLTVDLLQQGKLTVDGLITHRFPLERWREAIRTSQDKGSGAIKVAFEYR